MTEVAFPKVGSIVDGRYEIVKQLGVGGMGAVYQATFTSLGRTVALKILRPSLGEDGSYQERFKREAEIAGTIQHPGIVQVTDFGRLENGLLYMALDYVEGVELRKVVRSSKKGLPIGRIQTLFSQILEALSAAHGAGVVHRDLKPQNIMVQEINGKELIKILDFGIARMESLKTMTQAGQIMGTAAYMAPEQSKAMKVDARADLYAVGVMLYEAVTGRMPFSGKTVTDLIKKHRNAQAKDPCELRADLPARYGELILKALAKDPDDRFQSAAEFLQELEDASQEAILITEDPTGAVARAESGEAATAATAILAGTGDVGSTASLYTHLIGQTIDDKYKIIEKLGEGGMGAVYKAEHVLLGRPVGLKVMHPTHAQDPTFKERFLREVQVMMEFVHPNAIAVRDFGVSRDGLLFMTMDFSKGRPLKALIKSEGRLSEKRALAIIRQTLMALSEGHKRGIVHRDIKPDNILVEDGDQVKVLDFGIAKIVDGEEGPEEKAGLTGSHVIGTPHYMSPEQASGEKVDARADLYAVGCVLYELLCGEKVFQGTTVMQALMAHVTQVPIAVRERAPDAKISKATNDLVNRALAKDPNQRFASAAAFIQGINAIVGGAELADPESTGGTLQVTAANTGTVELGGASAGAKPAPRGAGLLIGGLVGAVAIAAVLVFLNKDKLTGEPVKTPEARTASATIPDTKTDRPPSDQPPNEQPPVEQPPVEQPPTEQPPVEQPPVEQPPAEKPPAEVAPTEVPKPEAPPVEVKPAAVEDGPNEKLSPLPPKEGPKTPPPVEQPPVEQPPVEQPPVEQPPVEQPPAKVDPKPPVAETPPPMEQPPVKQPPVEQPPVEQPPVEQPPREQPPVEQPPREQPPVEQPPVEQPPARVEPQDPPVEQPPVVVEPPPATPKVVEPPKPTRPSIAVLPFRFRNEVVQSGRGGYLWKIGAEESTTILTTDLTEKLVKVDRFDVVERERVAAAVREQDFGQEGRMDPSRTVDFGKMVGADHLILGDISELSFNQVFDDAGSFVRDRFTRRATLRMEVKLRVIDSRTTRVVAAETVSEEIVNVQRFLRAKLAMRPTIVMIRQLRRELTRKVALAALDAVDPLKVIGVNDDGSVVVNRGEVGSFETGQMIEVYETGEGTVDPKTNRLYPGRRKLVGKLEVTSVQKTIAVARVVEGKAEAGCFCKALAMPEKPVGSRPFRGKRRKKPGW